MTDYTVGEVAQLSGVSVRTLHHYDAIGLVTPADRSASGYRLYAEVDVERLRRVVYYRELGFGLEAIAEILADPTVGAEAHLRRQHQLLRERMERTEALLRAIEMEMEARTMGISLTPEEQFALFGTTRLGGEYAGEAEERWGDTPAWQESRRRTAAHSKEDWLAIKEEADALLRTFAEAHGRGAPADGEEATAIAERHRQYLRRWFYDCEPAMHRGLGELYVSDARFASHYDRVVPGLSRYVRDAIAANAARAA